MRIAIFECHTELSKIYSRFGKKMDDADILEYAVSTLVGDSGTVRVFRPYKNEYPKIGSFDGFIISGSNENADELSIRSNEWMRKLIMQIHEIHDRNIPILGICFGHQILSVAFEGRLFRLPELVVGFKKIVLQKEGVRTKLFEGVNKNFYGVFYHEWAVYKTSLPFGSKVLALSPDIPDQAVAFSIGKYTFGVQFHPERTKKDVQSIYTHRKMSSGSIESSKMNVRILRNFIYNVVGNKK